MAAQVFLDKWHSRGLDSGTLAAIRTEVFHISAPKPQLLAGLRPPPTRELSTIFCLLAAHLVTTTFMTADG